MLTTLNVIPLLDRLFDDVMYGPPGAAAGHGAFVPAIDVTTNADELVLVCDVPGVKQDDLELSVEGNVLTLKGQRRQVTGGDERAWLGRAYGSFERTFALPDDVNVEGLAADLADGVLTVRIPRRPEARPRRIAIGSGAPRQLGE